jgi:hypothetical protein
MNSVISWCQFSVPPWLWWLSFVCIVSSGRINNIASPEITIDESTFFLSRCRFFYGRELLMLLPGS